MNKKLSSLIGMLLCVNYSFSQCTPNPIYTSNGIFPDSATGLVDAYPFVHYEDVITVNVGSDTTMDLPGVGIVTLTINTLKLDTLRVISPNGDTVSLSSIDFTYTCNPADSFFLGNSSGCILISGDPTYGIPAHNQLILFLTMNATHPLLGTFDFPQVVNADYSIDAHVPPLDVITGTVYNDLNLNCIQDIGENGIPEIIVAVSPGNNYAITDASGYYSLTPDSTGIHTVSHTAHLYWENNCPQPSFTYTIDIDTLGLTIPNINFGDTFNDNINDMRVILACMVGPRPGFSTYFRVRLQNMGTSIMSGIVHLQYDQDLSFVDAIPSQTSSNSSEIQWNFTGISPGDFIDYSAHFICNAPWGSSVQLTATVTPTVGDTVPSDNTDFLSQPVTASSDPNIKEVIPEGHITDYNVYEQRYLTYTIHFQNTGNDTAFTVIVSDTISQNLSMETFEVLASSHPVTTSLNYPREIVWTFNNILLPDSNVNEPQSHGFVKYRMRVNNNTDVGDEIKNTAYIYFDFNEPVVTNTTITSVVMLPGFAENAINLPLYIYPNPNTGIVTIETGIAKGTYQLHDITGKALLQGSVTSTKFTLDISNLSSGVYFISVSDADKQVYGKVVKE